MVKMWLYYLIFGFYIQNVFSELFTTFVNFEKYYLMEEELTSLTEVIVHQEKITHENEDIHGFGNISELINESKDIHSHYVRHMDVYLSHPVNTFHLSKRLTKQWKGVLQQILKTDTCVKALRWKLQNMEDNIPTEEQLSKITMSLFNLDTFYNITLQELAAGNIFGNFADNPLSLSDMVYIARVAYDEEQYYFTITWLRHVISEMNSRQLEKVGNEYSKSAVYTILASAYSKMNHDVNAIELIDELLLFDPENEKAIRTKQYYTNIGKKGKPKEITMPISSKKSQRLFRTLCSDHVDIIDSRGKCLYFPLRNQKWYTKSNIKAEVISRKPLIIYFHRLIGNKTAKAIKHMGHETLLNLTSENRYSYPRQRLVVDIRHNISNSKDTKSCLRHPLYDNVQDNPCLSGVDDRTHYKWIPNLKEKFYSMDITLMPVRKSRFSVMNIGLDGFFLKREQRTLMPTGTFVISLVDKPFGAGGEFVFPLANIKTSVEKGDAIFYEGNTQFTICPIAYGTQWYGLQSLFEINYPSNVCPPKRRVKRGY